MTEVNPRRLSGVTKGLYGFGLSADGVLSNAFNVFLLFYYQQIVGLDPALTGLALFVAMVVDAITDPTIGVWSDGFRSRLGRRHPFMYAASLPMAACFLAAFLPPEDWSQTLLFLWLLVFSVGARFFFTLFAIPHQSLVPELTEDYDERTTLQSLRTVFAWIFGLLNALLAYRVFLRATEEYPQGLLNPQGYVGFAIWGASAILVTTLISSAGTQRAALAAAPDLDRIPTLRFRDVPRVVKEAFQSTSYRAAVFGGLCLYTSFGMSENMVNYINTFFWGFTSEQVSIFVIVILFASLLVLAITPPLAARFGKRNVAICAALGMPLIRPAVYGLRIFDILPGGGEEFLVYFLIVVTFLEYSAIIIGMTMVGAMIADITDEHELRTGARQEGLLFAANTFLYKSASGAGVLVAGFVIKLAGFPEGATIENTPIGVIKNLGLFAGLFMLAFGAANVFFFRKYDLSRERHAQIQAELRGRRSEPVSEPLPAS